MRITKTLTIILAIVILAIGCTKEKTNNLLTDNTPVQSSSSITLGNQSTSNNNCFFSFDSMKVYKFADAVNNQSVIDLIFFHNNPDNLAIFASPASIATIATIKPFILEGVGNGINYWTTKNSIKIGVTDISVSDFNNVTTNGQLNAAYENDYHVTVDWEIDISPNKVYKFTSNRTGKRGLIKVNSVNGNYNTSGQINFDIKMIK